MNYPANAYAHTGWPPSFTHQLANLPVPQVKQLTRVFSACHIFNALYVSVKRCNYFLCFPAFSIFPVSHSNFLHVYPIKNVSSEVSLQPYSKKVRRNVALLPPGSDVIRRTIGTPSAKSMWLLNI